MRFAIIALALFAAACETLNPIPPQPTPLPADGPIAYRCSDGTQLMVDLAGNQARVAIVGGPSMVLPNAGEDYYSNGRYGFRGGGRDAQWQVGGAAAVSCRGG